MAYLALTLNLNLSGNATFTYSGGAYGVNAELDATRTYAVSFYQMFARSMPVRQALAAACSGPSLSRRWLVTLPHSARVRSKEQQS